MSEYTLYCFAQSGNAYKTALMLELCQADWTPRFVDFFNGETKTPEYRSINEMGEVPVLEHKGIRLSQSGIILDYLSKILGKFGANNEEEEREIFRWLLFDNHKLTSSIATLRYLLQFAKTGETPLTEFLFHRAKGALTILNTRLTKHSFTLGDRPTIADFSMCGYLFWPEEFGISWKDYPAIEQWLERIKSLPRWTSPYQLMPGSAS